MSLGACTGTVATEQEVDVVDGKADSANTVRPGTYLHDFQGAKLYWTFKSDKTFRSEYIDGTPVARHGTYRLTKSSSTNKTYIRLTHSEDDPVKPNEVVRLIYKPEGENLWLRMENDPSYAPGEPGDLFERVACTASGCDATCDTSKDCDLQGYAEANYACSKHRCATSETSGSRSTEQGITDDERAIFYHLSLGARLLPLDWWNALEQPDSDGLFSDQDYLASEFGFVPDENSDFPVGVTVTDVQGNYLTPFDLKGDFVGFTCAACHTGEIHYGDERIQIEGGSGRIDIEHFTQEMLRALKETKADNDKWNRFQDRVQTGNGFLGFQLGPVMSIAISAFEYVDPIHVVEEGPGRSDTEAKAVTGFTYYDSSNRRELLGPVSIPSIWDTERYDYLHYTGRIRQPLARDVSVAIGAGAALDVRDGDTLYNSSVDILGIKAVEDLAAQIRSPKWPEGILGAIDHEAAGRGQTLYEDNCARCHDGEPHGNELHLTLVPVSELGTDPNSAEATHDEVRGMPQLGGDPIDTTELYENMTRGIIDYWFAVNGDSQREAIEGPRKNDYKARMAYKAAPLNGIWATPPYLHNGSVPTLADLLNRPSSRPRTFLQCYDTQYDPQRVGLAVETRTHCFFTLDTSISGNSNRGHTYGTTLSATEKADLLEYLKSL